MSDPIRIGVLGGTGLYEMDGLEVRESRSIDTPWGAPSADYVIGEMEGHPVAFLARHGAGHRLLPTEINYRANLYGFKSLGVEWLISVSAVGSMKEEYQPTDIVVPDQFVDRTRQRPSTFFGEGLVAHVALADPICGNLRNLLHESAKEAGARVHKGGTYLCMEGPQFSTRAESELYRSWGVDVIGMTNQPEARLAREAEICYGSLALVTDYDSWRDGEAPVSGESIMEVVRQNVATGQDVVRRIVRRLPIDRDCDCADALAPALITDWSLVPEQTLERLGPLIKRYRPRNE